MHYNVHLRMNILATFSCAKQQMEEMRFGGIVSRQNCVYNAPSAQCFDNTVCVGRHRGEIGTIAEN